MADQQNLAPDSACVSESTKYIEELKKAREGTEANLDNHNETIDMLKSELSMVERNIAKKPGIEALLAGQIKQRDGAAESLKQFDEQIAQEQAYVDASDGDDSDGDTGTDEGSTSNGGIPPRKGQGVGLPTPASNGNPGRR